MSYTRLLRSLKQDVDIQVSVSTSEDTDPEVVAEKITEVASQMETQEEVAEAEDIVGDMAIAEESYKKLSYFKQTLLEHELSPGVLSLMHRFEVFSTLKVSQNTASFSGLESFEDISSKKQDLITALEEGENSILDKLSSIWKKFINKIANVFKSMADAWTKRNAHVWKQLEYIKGLDESFVKTQLAHGTPEFKKGTKKFGTVLPFKRVYKAEISTIFKNAGIMFDALGKVREQLMKDPTKLNPAIKKTFDQLHTYTSKGVKASEGPELIALGYKTKQDLIDLYEAVFNNYKKSIEVNNNLANKWDLLESSYIDLQKKRFWDSEIGETLVQASKDLWYLDDLIYSTAVSCYNCVRRSW